MNQAMPAHQLLVIFDLDGTISLTEHRQHFLDPEDGGKPDWDAFFDACDQDLPNWPVINTLHALRDQGFRVEIWSGRSDAVRQKTEDWLVAHGIHSIPLHMRGHGDYTPDDELKEKWLGQEPWKPMMVFDDRDKVVAMWRRNGIVCAQVAKGEF